MYDVVLVDDEQIILQGLSRAFPWDAYACRVVATAVDGRDGLAAIRTHRPHILFTDIRMPNMDGLSMIAALKSEFPAMQVAVLTAFRDFDYAKEAIQLGVCRYLLKPSRMDELHEAVATMTRALQNSGPAPTDNAAAPVPLSEPAPPHTPCPDSATEPLQDGEQDSEAGHFVARAALKYIEEHCTERLSLADVADHVYVSQWHLSKLINRHARQSFFDLLNSYRIQRAQAMLADPMYKISEIAYAVGYADVAHFSRIFKKMTGSTPMAFRNDPGHA